VSVDFENQGQENMGISLEEFVANRGEFAGTPHFIDTRFRLGVFYSGKDGMVSGTDACGFSPSQRSVK
jgi:hypothetical protein